MEVLAELPVVGVKDSSGDPARLLRSVTEYDGAVYVGSSALATMAGQVGAAGVILALANAEPERCVAAFAGDAEAQRQLTPGHLATGRQPGQGIKPLVADRFGISAHARVGR